MTNTRVLCKWRKSYVFNIPLPFSLCIHTWMYNEVVEPDDGGAADRVALVRLVPDGSIDLAVVTSGASSTSLVRRIDLAPENCSS
jgi:hypothetical protein